MSLPRMDQLLGALLGTAVGDAIGVPREGLSPGRARRLLGDRPLRHQLLFGRGLVSDDTEHACLLGQSLLRQPEDADRFARALGGYLRCWLLCGPPGIGRATLQAILKLGLGFSPARSGVWSAGNGPAMRAALLGICLGHDPDRLRAYVRASTRLAHTEPRAERGALLVALAAHHGAERGPAGVNGPAWLAALPDHVPDIDPELGAILTTMAGHLERQASPAELAATLGLARGVTGYIYHTVPLALYGWLRHPGDFREAVETVIVLGGDADTTGAIVGALMGGTVGASGIPADWIDGLVDRPFSVRWMHLLAEELSRRFPADGPGSAQRPVPFMWPALPIRNLLFLSIVLGHVARRALPPY